MCRVSHRPMTVSKRCVDWRQKRSSMKIRFETSLDDVVAFNRFHLRNSPAWRKQVWFQMLIVPVFLGGLLLFVGMSVEDAAERRVFLLGAGILVVMISLVWAL